MYLYKDDLITENDGALYSNNGFLSFNSYPSTKSQYDFQGILYLSWIITWFLQLK